VELPFRINISLIRKLSGYELPAISKWHNVVRQFSGTHRKPKEHRKKNEKQNSIYFNFNFILKL
tara:strand:+ start:2442 stop:2633 length:192 start_codon:yes stop_codon:yes gene_type:complete